MNKQELKKLRPGKKIYVVDMDDYCDCPHCDGLCAEPTITEAVVESTDLRQSSVSYTLDFGPLDNRFFAYIHEIHMERVFTRKRDAEREYKKLEREVFL